MARKPRTDSDLRAASDALAYEAEMLMFATHQISTGLDPLTNNMATESFLLHFRNLRDFLYPHMPERDDIIADDFFDPPNQWNAPQPHFLSQQRWATNLKLGHLSYERIESRYKDKNWQLGKMFVLIWHDFETFVTTAPKDRLDDRLFLILQQARDLFQEGE